MKFSISVIIPAFNVERFVEKSIKSALKQPEVFEVIVVNDGSTDNTYNIIKEMQSKNSKIKLFHHINRSNKGRSASRNLGIKNASVNIIAFLDADDFYNSNRFKNDKALFEKDDTIEVVYNAVGYHFYRELKDEEREYFKKLNTVSQPLENKDVFDALISSKYGYLHLNGLTVKKSVVEKVGYFNEKLPVAEDSDYIYKLGLKCQFHAGVIDEPLAYRGIHEENIYNDEELYQKWNIKLYESLISWCYKQRISNRNIDNILKWLWIIKFRENKGLLQNIYYWLGFSLRNPKTILSIFFIKYFPLFKLRKKLFPLIFKNILL